MIKRKIQISNICNMCKMKGKQHNRLSFVLILKPSSCLLVLFCNGGVFITNGGSKVVVGISIAKGGNKVVVDDLCTKNLVPGKAVYKEKINFVQVTTFLLSLC
ncbi:hypothetical protein AABB24_029967 [Solanum stoloniferum]|uniref:Uncharacterized protein n=1 Tax=Solanum stoloniferum TaxID=62892 RepID=A0ABD2S087_9SOLN